MKKLLYVLAIVSVFAITLVAQTNTGRLTGTVSGPDGVLPGATVVLKDKKDRKGGDRDIERCRRFHLQ